MRCATGYGHSASGFLESNSPKVLLVVTGAKSDGPSATIFRGFASSAARFTSRHPLLVESKIACTLRIQPCTARIQNGDFMPEPRDSAAGRPRPDPDEKLVKV